MKQSQRLEFLPVTGFFFVILQKYPARAVCYKVLNLLSQVGLLPDNFALA